MYIQIHTLTNVYKVTAHCVRVYIHVCVYVFVYIVCIFYRVSYLRARPELMDVTPKRSGWFSRVVPPYMDACRVPRRVRFFCEMFVSDVPSQPPRVRVRAFCVFLSVFLFLFAPSKKRHPCSCCDVF